MERKIKIQLILNELRGDLNKHHYNICKFALSSPFLRTESYVLSMERDFLNEKSRLLMGSWLDAS